MVTLFQNGIDMLRRKVHLKMVEGNVGGNYISEPTDEVVHSIGSGTNVFETILLSDVFEAMYVTTRHQHDTMPTDDSGPLPVLVGWSKHLQLVSHHYFTQMYFQLKMDIEGYECRAIMGSQDVFSDSRFNITAIVTEWKYGGNGGFEGRNYSTLCPFPKRFVQFLVQNNYIPTKSESGQKLDPDESHTWEYKSHIFWEKDNKMRN